MKKLETIRQDFVANVKHIVMAHNGNKTVESEVGNGSVFKIYLPK